MPPRKPATRRKPGPAKAKARTMPSAPAYGLSGPEITLDSILATAAEMSGIAGNIARDQTNNAQVRIQAASAAAKIASQSAPIIRMREEMEYARMRRASDILAYPDRSDPFAEIEHREAVVLLESKTLEIKREKLPDW